MSKVTYSDPEFTFYDEFYVGYMEHHITHLTPDGSVPYTLTHALPQLSIKAIKRIKEIMDTMVFVPTTRFPSNDDKRYWEEFRALVEEVLSKVGE